MDFNVTIRLAGQADWQAIIDIYNQGIEDGCNAFQQLLTVEGHRHWLELHNRVEYAIFVAEVDGTVVGWCSLSPYRIERLAFRRTGEIVYYFDRVFRGKGIGSLLVTHAVGKAPLYGLGTLLAFLLDTNTVSAHLLEKTGFERWGHFQRVADFDGRICGQFVYGKILAQ